MQTDHHQLLIDIPSQQLFHLVNAKPIKTYLVSTGLNGVGEQFGSGQTPRGWHVIRAKIGGDQPINSTFIARRPTGEIYSSQWAEQYPDKDWILTRIMWLSGLEVGKNRLGNCDTMRRFIYIHGCPDHRPMGIPLSKGCIRMRNDEIIELFDNVPVRTKVFIRG